MQRGEVWTVRDQGHASKARPVIVVQDEEVASFDSVILCLLTSFDSEGIPTRVRIDPSENNGLRKVSFAMTDKIVTVDKSLLGERLGAIGDGVMREISNQMRRILGLL